MPPIQQPNISTQFTQQPSVPVDGSVQRENAGFIAPGQSAITFNIDKVSVNGGAITIPLITPRSGQSYQITDFYFSHDASVALRMALTVTSGGQSATIWSGPVKGDTAPVQQAGQETQLSVPSGAQLSVVFPANTSTNVYANISGILQAVGIG